MTMNLDFLDFQAKPAPQHWTPVSVVFIGGDKYELISVATEVRIKFVKGGFETVFKEMFAVPAELLLGSCFRKTKIFDIEIRLPDFTMSVAAMYPGKFPREVVAGELVRIHE